MHFPSPQVSRRASSISNEPITLPQLAFSPYHTPSIILCSLPKEFTTATLLSPLPLKSTNNSLSPSFSAYHTHPMPAFPAGTTSRSQLSQNITASPPLICKASNALSNNPSTFATPNAFVVIRRSKYGVNPNAVTARSWAS